MPSQKRAMALEKSRPAAGGLAPISDLRCFLFVLLGALSLFFFVFVPFLRVSLSFFSPVGRPSLLAGFQQGMRIGMTLEIKQVSFMGTPRFMPTFPTAEHPKALVGFEGKPKGNQEQ